ncbi:unnamed protein product [Adineta ricciae]|uniref:G-protein coupled receptors family 1 profile domain-containing protein n=1 Tax=Adineta ricciae TaxID=249248 RepID=A0A814KWC6_ADIRI|nr:unnamed protein product [Adineta ricciae]CAF1286971.1 unnamed protein product [Adineta ricciae]
MSVASASSLTTIFNGVNWSFNYVILPICFILGNFGNCLNLLIFARPSSRSNSCFLYFLSASVINVIILNFGLVLRLLRGLWSIDPALTLLWFCRLRTYLIGASFLIYRLSILFACVDRMCASSRSAWIRMESRPKVAHRLIILIWIFCVIYLSPSLIYQTIVYGQCLAPPNTIYATYSTISTLIQGLFIPSSMILCGVITFLHLKTMQKRVEPQHHLTGQNERHVLGQYLAMLVVQVITDFLCNILYPAYLIYNLIYPAPTPTTLFILNLAFTTPYLNFGAAFYLYTLSSPKFRRKLVRVLKQIKWIRENSPDDRSHGHTATVASLRHQPVISALYA